MGPRGRFVVLAAAVAAATTVLAPPGAAGTRSWETTENTWGTPSAGVHGVAAFTTATTGWLTGWSGALVPGVQRCEPACEYTALPVPALPGVIGAAPNAIDGTSDDDVWVAGLLYEQDQPGYRALSWQWDGSTWAARLGPAPAIQFTRIVSAGGGQAWALGRVPTRGGAQLSVVYHYTGSAWTEVSPAGGPREFPGDCRREPLYRQWADLVMVDGAPVLLGTCLDLRPYVLRLSGGRWRDISPPAGALPIAATAVGNTLWTLSDDLPLPLIQRRRSDGVWEQVPTTGLTPEDHLLDLAGGPVDRVIAVGDSTLNGRTHPTVWAFHDGRWRREGVPPDLPRIGYLINASVGAGGRSVALFSNNTDGGSGAVLLTRG